MAEILVEDYFVAEGGAADDSTDCTAALQAAIDDAAVTNGSTIVFPTGICRLAGTLTKDFLATQGILTFKGSGGSAIRFMTVEYNRFTISNMEKVSFRDLVFLGDNGGVGVNTEANNAHFLCGAIQTVFDNCMFYGLRIENGGLGIIYTGGNLTIRDCQILGCAGPVIVRFNASFGLRIFNTQFIDYGTYGNLYISKTPASVGVWVAGEDGAQTNARELSSIVIEGCSFDEGAAYAVSTDGIRHITIRNCAQNVGTSDVGMYFKDAHSVHIDQSWWGYNPDVNVKALICEDVRQLEMNNCMLDDGANRVELLGSMDRAVFNNVKHDAVLLTAADVINTAGAVLDFNGVRSRGTLKQIG